MTKLVFISNKHTWQGILTKLFTGDYIYHCGWLVDDMFYDMHLLRRRRSWPRYEDATKYIVEFPQVTKEYLESRLTEDESVYGILDYLLFGLRPIYHFFGVSTRNNGGVICSEMCSNDLSECNVTNPFRASREPPSPVDLYKWAISI